MASIFTRIINGEIPGRIVWDDEHCVAMVDIRPLNTGHCLVIPKKEIDHWIDLDPELATHLMGVAQMIGQAQDKVFAPNRIGLMIAGFEVAHAHVHVVPINSMAHLDFSSADPNPDPAQLDQVAAALSRALVELGYREA